MKKLLVFIILVVFCFSWPEVIGQGEPPHPNGGNDPGSGNTPVGGGAPVGEGVISLITMAALLGATKVIRNSNLINSQATNKKA